MAQTRTNLILLDTDVIVDYLRGYAPAVRFFSALGGSEVHYAAMTETELVSGSANADEKMRDQLMQLLRQWTKISFGNPIAAFAGDLRREHGLSIPDAIIAATARSHNATLITRNVKDFAQVPNLRVSAPYS